MTKVTRQVTFHIPRTQESAWSIGLSTEPTGELYVNMFWGDKELPTHVLVVSKEDAEPMLQELLESVRNGSD